MVSQKPLASVGRSLRSHLTNRLAHHRLCSFKPRTLLLGNGRTRAGQSFIFFTGTLHEVKILNYNESRCQFLLLINKMIILSIIIDSVAYQGQNGYGKAQKGIKSILHEVLWDWYCPCSFFLPFPLWYMLNHSENIGVYPVSDVSG